MSGDLVVRPEQLRELAVPVGVVGFVVRELSGHLGPGAATGSAELTDALAELGGAWGAALRAHGEAATAVAQRLRGAAETYEAVETLLLDAMGR